MLLVSVTDECTSDPCSSGATCVDGFLSFSCICVDGTIGDRCQCRQLIMYHEIDDYNINI